MFVVLTGTNSIYPAREKIELIRFRAIGIGKFYFFKSLHTLFNISGSFPPKRKLSLGQNQVKKFYESLTPSPRGERW